jgi:hypothetical protein
MSENPSPQSTDRESGYNEENWSDVPDQEYAGSTGGRRGYPTAWVAGIALIALGVVFLLQNMGAVFLDNWWALFILIPAFGSFATAWHAYRTSGGSFNSTARGSLFAGLVMIVVASIFLFNMDWGKIWPVFIILAGVAALFSGLLSGRG